MFRKLFRLSKFFRLKAINDHQESMENNNDKAENIPRSINDIKEKLRETFSESSDFILREVVFGQEYKVQIIITYIEGLANQQLINSDVLKSLMIDSRISHLDKDLNKNTVIDILKENVLNASDISEVSNFEETIDHILSGDTIIYIDGKNIALNVGTCGGWEARNVEKPDTESVVRGPREGFVESIRTNTSLLRRKIKNPKLKFETIKLGEQTNTEVCICYLKGIAHDDIVETVRRRLKKIKIDAILDSGYLEQFIEDAPFSLFQTVGNSEKPDKVAAKVLEGRVAILCDGSPFVLTVPYLFVETIQASEDYYSRAYIASFNRLLRVIALLISGTLPGFYVALLAFHSDVIPFELLISIASSTEQLPFTPFIEAISMIIAFELLREAGIRMPRPIGQAVSIVGALVLGEAAVNAGLASNIMIIIIALTGISSFIVPAIGDTLPIFRILMICGANVLGLLGMALVLVVIFIHMCSLRSFGVPYMAPFAPFNGMDLKDTFVKFPLWMMTTRPKSLTSEKSTRSKE